MGEYSDYGALSAFSTALGGVFSMKNTQDTNRMNKVIAAQNREWQEQENARQRDWEEAMWNKEMQYNSPAAIMERYRQAGINPFIGQSKIGEGTTSAPSAPAPQSAPHTPTMMPTDFSFVGDSVSRLADYALRKQEVDANSANQQAQTIKAIGDAAEKLYRAFGAERTEEILSHMFANIRGSQMDSSLMARSTVANLRKQENEAQISDVEKRIAQNLGYEKAQRELWNMDYEYQRMVAEVGLWSSLAKLNDSNVRLNEAKVDTELAQQKELVARAFKEWKESAYIQSLKLTEDEQREWFVGKLKMDFCERAFDVDDRAADWAFDQPIRDAKRDPDYQERNALRFGLDNTYGSVIYDKFTKMANQAVDGGLRSSKVEHINPARAAEKRNKYDYVRKRVNRSTYSGKESYEWYYPNP